MAAAFSTLTLPSKDTAATHIWGSAQTLRVYLQGLSSQHNSKHFIVS